MIRHGDNSPLSEREQQAIRDGEAAWLRVSSSDWDAITWSQIGGALLLLRQQTLHELGTNVARGSLYNKAFAARIAKTKFATMEPVTRSNLLFLMEPDVRIVVDRLLASWTPDVRARRTHPTTLAQYVRKELKPPKPQPASKAAPSAPASSQALADALAKIERLTKELAAAKRQEPAKPAPEAKGATAMTLDMISSKTGREQAEVFMRQYEKKMRQKEAEIKEQLRVEFVDHFADLTAEYREKEKHYDLISGRHKGFMTKADYTNIMFCIHPDTEHRRSDKQRNAAQQLWKELEKVMVKAEHPLPMPSSLPQTKEELLKRKAEYDAKRAKERAAKREATGNMRRR